MLITLFEKVRDRLLRAVPGEMSRLGMSTMGTTVSRTMTFFVSRLMALKASSLSGGSCMIISCSGSKGKWSFMSNRSIRSGWCEDS